VWLMPEAIETQELHWLALDVAIDAERWAAIASSDISIPDVEAEPTYPNRQSLFCHGNVPPRAWIPHTSRLDKPNIAYLQAGVNTSFSGPLLRQGWLGPHFFFSAVPAAALRTPAAAGVPLLGGPAAGYALPRGAAL